MRYFVLIGVMIAITATWTGAWFYMSKQVQNAVETFLKKDIPGRKLAYQKLQISGFPFQINIIVQRPILILSGRQRRIRWETNNIKVARHLWQPRQYFVDLTGQHLLTLHQNGQTQRLRHRNELATSRLETDEKGQFQLLTLDISSPTFEIDGRSTAQGKRLEIRAERNPVSIRNLDLMLRGEQFTITEQFMSKKLSTLGREIRLLDIRATATRIPDEITVEKPGGLWRDGGGTLEVRQFRLKWSEVEISAKGSLSLDFRMRPIGALTAQIKGHEKLIDLVIAGSGLRNNNAVAARAVLGLLAAAGGGILSVPVRLQDGQLFLGPASIADLAPLELY